MKLHSRHRTSYNKSKQTKLVTTKTFIHSKKDLKAGFNAVMQKFYCVIFPVTLVTQYLPSPQPAAVVEVLSKDVSPEYDFFFFLCSVALKHCPYLSLRPIIRNGDQQLQT